MIKKVKRTDVKYLRAYLVGDSSYFEYWRFKDPNRVIDEDEFDFSDFKDAYPSLVGHCDMEDEDRMYLEIDVENGIVTNWPKGITCDFYNYKIVDEGVYQLVGKDGEILAEYGGYVPDCIGQDGYGDYLEFYVDENGKIDGLVFRKQEFDEFIESADYDDDDE